MITVIGDPNFIILRVNRHTHGPMDPSSASVNDAYGSNITAALSVKNQDRIVSVICYCDRVAHRIDSDSHRPVKLRPFALKGSQRLSIAFGLRGINRD